MRHEDQTLGTSPEKHYVIAPKWAPWSATTRTLRAASAYAMAVFLNRHVQAMLNDCSGWMPRDQIERLVSRINKRDIDSLSATWELVIAHSLSRHGDLQYEPNLQGGAVADLLFRQTGTELQFLSEVTSLSDEGLDAQNPSWEFAKELFRRVKRHGLSTTHIFYTIGHVEIGEAKKKKIALSIPKQSRFHSFFGRFVDPHLERIRSEHLSRHEIHVTSEGYDVRILYDARISGASGQHRAYSFPLSLTVNPISNKLREKARQLRKTGYVGAMGIFLCDAGSSLLGRKTSRLVNRSFSDEEIIWEFLRQNSSVSFVQTYFIVQEWQPLQVQTKISIQGKLFVNPTAAHPLPEAAQKVLLELPSGFPKPVETALSAYQDAKSHHRLRRKGRYSPLIWTSQMVKLPARAFVDLLAGRLSKEKFDDMMRTSVGNIVERQLQSGNIVKNIYVEGNSEADDDWIVLEFDFDPAAGRLVKRSPDSLID
jgi:hypothetical protein